MKLEVLSSSLQPSSTLAVFDPPGAMSSLGLIKLQGPLANLGRRAVYAARMPTSQQAVRVRVRVLAKA